MNPQRLPGAGGEGHQGTQCGGSPHVMLHRVRWIVGGLFEAILSWVLVLGFQQVHYAGKLPLSAHWELEERAQRKTGVDTLLHRVLPLGFANERG